MSNDKTLATAKHGGCVKLGTPGSRWAASGEPDPHGSRYDCERAALAMGDLTDDELANAVFMHGNERQTMAELVGGATPAIAYLTAAKDRIRWLSRALAAAEALSAQPSPGGQGDELPALPHPNYPISKTGLQNNLYTASQMQDYARTALAARQPVVVDLPESLHDRVEALREVAARQPVESEENVAADTYWTLAEMIEPHVQREGINPDGALPASVHDSVAILLEHWLRTRQPVGELHLPPDGFYKIVFEDAEVPDESFARSGALDAALRRFEQISNKWNAHLFVRFANNTRDCTVPNATPAQAVDLGAVREAVRKAWQKCAAGESVDFQFGTLLALIDSKADGNG
ncbi:hypothetical protein [Stenotrophomonas sp. FR010]|uniref:hypothetical protein n=1 Tax=Stenotrophomonas sp. FR010 TaxID=3398458 RepID=UPI0039C71AF5